MNRDEVREIARLREELGKEKAYSLQLKLALEANGIAAEFESIHIPDAIVALAPGPRKVVEHLIAAFPRYLSKEFLDRAVPPKDAARVRDLKFVDVYVNSARKVLSYEAIENLWGEGYRMAPWFMAKILGKEDAECVPPTPKLSGVGARRHHTARRIARLKHTASE